MLDRLTVDGVWGNQTEERQREKDVCSRCLCKDGGGTRRSDFLRQRGVRSEVRKDYCSGSWSATDDGEQKSQTSQVAGMQGQDRPGKSLEAGVEFQG
jgi:hypothetical protein